MSKSKKGKIIKIDGETYICLDDNCVRYEYFPETARLDKTVKEECEDFTPDPNFGRNLGMIYSHMRKRNGKERTIFEDDNGEY